VEVLAHLAYALDEDFLWSGTARRDALSPRGLGRGLEEREWAVKVHRPAFQVIRPLAPTNTAVVSDRPTA
jgi:hypothetical protein